MAKTATKSIEKETRKPAEILRKGALAYLGLYGMAYERAKFRAEQLRGGADELFGTCVEKGTGIEAQAGVFAKTAQTKASERFATTSTKLRGVLPKASNDRVEELEAEVAALNKTITAMAKKASKPARKAKMITQKTAKASPVKQPVNPKAA